MFKIAIFLAAGLGAAQLALPARALEQLKANDDIVGRYAKAATMTRTPLAGYALNTYVIPHWIPGRDAFWYRRQTAKGAEFVLVNAETGSKSPAFPHSAMAKELSRVLGEPVTPDALPMQTLDFKAADSSVSFSVKATSIRCRLDPGVACEKAPTEGVGPDVAMSPDKTKGVFVRLGNLWLRDLNTGGESALTSDGSPDNGYGIGLDLGDQRHLVRLRSGAPSPPLGVHWSPDSHLPKLLAASRASPRLHLGAASVWVVSSRWHPPAFQQRCRLRPGRYCLLAWSWKSKAELGAESDREALQPA